MNKVRDSTGGEGKQAGFGQTECPRADLPPSMMKIHHSAYAPCSEAEGRADGKKRGRLHLEAEDMEFLPFPPGALETPWNVSREGIGPFLPRVEGIG